MWNGQFGATALNKGTESQWKAGTPIETNFLGYEGLEIQAIAGMGVHRLNINDQILNNSTYKNYLTMLFQMYRLIKDIQKNLPDWPLPLMKERFLQMKQGSKSF